MSFTGEIRLFSKRSLQATERVRRGVCIKLFNAVILDTPVDTGRLRGNWQTSVAAPKLVPTDRKDKPGTAAMAEVLGNLGDGTRDDIAVFLTNSLPYAHRIEYDGWSKRKAPLGMVRRNAIRITNLVNQAVKEGRL